MTKLLIGFIIALLFIGGSTLLAYFYPQFGTPLAVISSLGGAVGGSLICLGVLEMRTR